MRSWSDGYVVEGKVPLDSMSYPLHYAGPSVWEGLRAYVQSDGSCRIFKLREHVLRLRESAKILGVSFPYTDEQVEDACQELVRQNGGGDLYLRPIAYLDADAEGIHARWGTQLKLDVYCVPIGKPHPDPAGIKMVVSGVVRSYPQYTMQAKTPANYAVSAHVEPLLGLTGAHDAFLVDAQGYVVEAVAANFFVAKGDVLMTPPNAGSILPGITRRTVAEVLGDSARMFSEYKRVPKVVEKHITKADLYTADCVFLCGTYVEVVKVCEVDGRNVDVDDFYFRLVAKEYERLVRGAP